jgi:2-dehydropantoate 2-reductase
MLQDVKHHKRTEIDAMNGAVVRLAEQKGIATPVNWLLTRLVHAKESLPNS